MTPSSGTAKLTILRSTLANNLGLQGAGGVYVVNGPGSGSQNSVSIIDSTISGNQAGSNGGGVAIGFFDSLTVRDSTITGNNASAGGGIFVSGSGGGTVNSPVLLTNALIAGNTAGGAPDCQDNQGVTDGGHNLLGVQTGCVGIVNGVNGDQAGTTASPLDPHLGPLANNGGATQTRALLAGSPAINAGSATDCNAAPVSGTDQRAINRNASTRLVCDVGAYDTGKSLQTLYVAHTAAADPACAAASKANPFKTIAGALGCASSGTTIMIGTGTFAGGFTIAKNVVLIGSGAATVISDPSAATQSVTEVALADGSFVTIKGITVNGDGAQSDVVVGSGSLTVVNSTITGGVGSAAGGIAVTPSSGTAKLTILRSTLANNLGLQGAGGVYVVNGPGSGSQNSVSIIDSTISGNQAGSNGGGVAIGFFDSLTVRDSTITGNNASAGGGIFVSGSGGGTVNSPVLLTNALIAGNTAGGAPDCQDNQGVTDGGHNLLGVQTGCVGIVNGVNGDQAGTTASPLDPHLGPLANNGGATQTRALLAGSPAINAGSATDCNAAPVSGTDQRAINRNAKSRNACDVGAYDTRRCLSRHQRCLSTRTERREAEFATGEFLTRLCWLQRESAQTTGCRRRDSNPRHADYDSARFPSVYRRYGRFWTVNWTVLSRNVHETCDCRPRMLPVFQGAGSRNAHASLMTPIRSIRSRAATPRTRGPASAIRRASTSANRSPRAQSRLDAATTEPWSGDTASPSASTESVRPNRGSSSEATMWVASGSAGLAR